MNFLHQRETILSGKGLSKGRPFGLPCAIERVTDHGGGRPRFGDVMGDRT